jgi:hypothetical protein
MMGDAVFQKMILYGDALTVMWKVVDKVANYYKKGSEIKHEGIT